MAISSTSRSIVLRVFLLVTLLLIGFTPPASAQPPGWTPLDLGLRSGFSRYEDRPQRIYFQDSLLGWIDVGGSLYYNTVDGGATWMRGASPLHIPRRAIGNGVVLGLDDGYISTDDGTTWDRPELGPEDSTQGTMLPSGYAVADERHRAALFSGSLRYYDSTLERERFTEIGRMAVSSDGGHSWRFLDSGIIASLDGRSVGALDRRSKIGMLPSPDNFSRPRLNWSFPVAMPDSATLLAVLRVSDDGVDTLRNDYYLGRIDLESMTSEWSVLPMWRNIAPGSGAEPNKAIPTLTDLRQVGPNLLFIRQIENRADRYPSYVARTGLWRSDDSGRSWAPVNVPSWVDSSQITFLSPTHGATSNAVTYDGGQIWEPRGIPFESWEGSGSEAFFALDSLHYVFANVGALFASSTDAGRTWRRNDACGLPRSIAVYRDRILIGREYRSLLLSPDGGATWEDVDRSGGLPGDLSVVWSLAYPDSSADPQRVVGLAGFVSPGGRRYGATIVSDDGGRSWVEGEEFPISTDSVRLRAFGGTSLFMSSRLFFCRNAEGSGTRGFIVSADTLLVSDDDGVHWRSRGAFPYAALEMEDSEHGIAAATGDEPGLVATSDGGLSWRTVLSLSSRTVVGLQSTAPGEYRCLVGNAGGAALFGSSDGGESWEPLEIASDTVPGRGSAVWANADRLLAVAGRELYRSTNGGKSFSLSWLQTPPLAVGRNSRYFYVGLEGNQAARLDFDPGAVGSVRSPDDGVAAVVLAENPAPGEIVLRFDGDAGFPVMISMIDMMGRVVARSTVPFRTGGEKIVVPTNGLPSGCYVVAVRSKNMAVSLPVVLLR